MFRKLRVQFLLMHMGVVVLLITLFFGSALAVAYNDLERGTDGRLERMRYARTARQGAYVLFDAETDATFFRRAFTPGPGMPMLAQPGIYIALDGQGQIKTVASAYDADDGFYTRIAGEALRGGAGGKIRLSGLTLKYRALEGELYFIDITREQELLYGMLRIFLLIALPLLAVIFGVSWAFARSAVRPIEAGYNRQRAFVADASHELKTPLAAMSANVEVLIASSAPAQQKWLDYVKSEITRMAALTNSLLSLAKLDEEAAMPETRAVDLSDVLTACLLPLDAVLYEKGMALATDITPDLRVKGDEAQLRQLIGIWVDNALRYGEKNITVSLKKTPGGAALTVTNDGPGIAPDKINQVWERFYRVDDARAYDGGFGLGLPMAKAIAARHGGKVNCESKEGETRFTAVLPVS